MRKNVELLEERRGRGDEASPRDGTPQTRDGAVLFTGTLDLPIGERVSWQEGDRTPGVLEADGSGFYLSSCSRCQASVVAAEKMAGTTSTRAS